ncbi:hypothetical protein OHA40_30825 [Nocardia sp. NBC_00508]|uniref:hypothetical protein n=1 Tax=Nocardia sp. NBC_00508 TaxID=2975992 RepID=UPI002E82166C|nr:hypothetical protein [Nocardia sp. NBC_00508]WUD65927.1 hypothetical protein OHA40_30825 [Nocardia sp. NBC_00508]
MLGSRLFWAILVDAMTLVAWVWIAYMLIRSRRVAAAFDSTVEAGHEIWHSSNTAITDPLGTPLWHGCRARRRLTEITAPDAATNFHVRSADGVLALDYPDGTPAGRIEADRYAANRLSYTIFDATGTPRAYLASTGVTDSTWAATGVDETPYARFVLAPGRNHTALAPVTPPPLRPLLAAFLLDYDRMLLEGGTRPGGVAELQRRAKR